jgi:hypothetical protein
VIDTACFPGGGSGYYWSGTTYSYFGSDLGRAVVLYFLTGEVVAFPKCNAYHVRCVRAGPGFGPFDTLSIIKSGAVGGVSSEPPGIDCGPDCTHQFEDGATVVLTAQPGVRAKFKGWSGGNCSGTGTCTVTMNGDVTVTAVSK